MGNFQSSDQSAFVKLVNDISQSASNNIFQANSNSCASTQNATVNIGSGAVVDCSIEIDQAAQSICNVTTTQAAQQSAQLSSDVSNKITQALTSKQKSTQGFLAAAVSAQVNTQSISDDIQNNVSNTVDNKVFQNCASSTSIDQNGAVNIGAGAYYTCPATGKILINQGSMLQSAQTCGQTAVQNAVLSAKAVNDVTQTMTSEQVSSQGLDLGMLLVLLAIPFIAGGKGVSSITTVPRDSEGNAQWGVYGLHVGILGAIIFGIVAGASAVWSKVHKSS